MPRQPVEGSGGAVKKAHTCQCSLSKWELAEFIGVRLVSGDWGGFDLVLGALTSLVLKVFYYQTAALGVQTQQLLQLLSLPLTREPFPTPLPGFAAVGMRMGAMKKSSTGQRVMKRLSPMV